MDNHLSSLYWVGPRLSDLLHIEHLFKGAIVLSGNESTASINIHCFESKTKKRININDPGNANIISEFYCETTSQVLKNDEYATFLWYSSPPSNVSSDVLRKSPYTNDISICQILNNKFYIRSLLSEKIDVVPSKLCFGFDINKASASDLFPDYPKHVVQEQFGSGGYQTFIFEDDKPEPIEEKTAYVVSPYIENAVPINQHAVIEAQRVQGLHPSIQLIKEIDDRLIYMGSDFSLSNNLADELVTKINQATLIVGKYCQQLGYRGVLGVDYVLSQSGELAFIEVNPRFQGSTNILNIAYSRKGFPPVQQLHINSFLGLNVDIAESIEDYSSCSQAVLSSAYHSNIVDIQHDISSPDSRISEFNIDNMKVIVATDGSNQVCDFEYGSHSHKYILNRPISAIDTTNNVILLPAFNDINERSLFYSKSIEINDIDRIARFKFDLFSLGMTISKNALTELCKQRQTLTIRDGIAGGIELRLFDDIYINVPVKESFSFLSPFKLHWTDVDGFHVQFSGRCVCRCKVLPLPSFSGKKLSSGMKYEEIGQIFTDRLGIYPFRSCRYNSRNNKACKFCEIGYQTPMAPVPLEEISELLEYCLNNKQDNMRHILISGGVPSKNRWKYLVDTIKVVRNQTDLNIYHMLEPPENLDSLDLLYEAGVNEIGFNLEIYNREIAKDFMPGKGAISYEKYREAMLYARELWPSPGAVRSLLIVGLEPLKETLKGVEALASIGVMPILSPFRPVPGTELWHLPPPSGSNMYSVWKSAQKICEKYDLTLGPTCVACQNNTITVPVNRAYKHY